MNVNRLRRGRVMGRRGLRGLRQYRRLRPLVLVARELHILGLSVWFSGSPPCVRVRTGLVVPVLLRVTLDPSGRFFEWRDGYNRHPSNDPAGAARQIVAYIKAREPRAGERS